MSGQPTRPRLARAVFGDGSTPLEVLFGEDRYAEHLRRLAVRWLVPTSMGIGAAAIAASGAVSNGRRLVVLLALFFSVVLFLLTVRMRPQQVSSDLYIAMGVFGCGVTLACIWAVGPAFGVAATAIAGASCLAAVALNRRGFLLVTGELLVGYAVLVSVVDGYPRPVAQVLACATFTAVSASVVRWAVTQVEHLASELAIATDRLQQYVAPQVATAVRTATDLEPHRRKIAVWFCDLRGFTSFSAGAEPEEVVEVLGQYYAAVGDLATRSGATIGAFAGDGIHGYFGDPTPLDDPAVAAVDFALALRLPMDELCARWSAHGFSLGYGVGVAFGYATLGTVGYEGRRDYTALGSVVNLAARLCGEAANREILLDTRVHDAVPDGKATPVTVTLKGMPGPTTAYKLD